MIFGWAICYCFNSNLHGDIHSVSHLVQTKQDLILFIARRQYFVYLVVMMMMMMMIFPFQIGSFAKEVLSTIQYVTKNDK